MDTRRPNCTIDRLAASSDPSKRRVGRDFLAFMIALLAHGGLSAVYGLPRVSSACGWTSAGYAAMGFIGILEAAVGALCMLVMFTGRRGAPHA